MSLEFFQKTEDRWRAMREPPQRTVPNLDSSARPHPTAPPLPAASEPPAVVMATRARLSQGRCQPCSPHHFLPPPSVSLPPLCQLRP